MLQMRLLIGSRLFVLGTRFFSFSNISDMYPDSYISILKAFVIYKILILLIKLAEKYPLAQAAMAQAGQSATPHGLPPMPIRTYPDSPQEVPQLFLMIQQLLDSQPTANTAWFNLWEDPQRKIPLEQNWNELASTATATGRLFNINLSTRSLDFVE